MPHRMQSRSIQTRERILAAAAPLFAKRGFRATTTAEICRRAGVNGAAIHYHFGSKQELYAAAWEHAFRAMVEKYPPDGGVPCDAPPAERLRGHIHSVLQRLADPESLAFDMVQREFAEPTGLLTEVMRACIQPLRDALAGIVRDLLGDGDAPPEVVERCVMSIKAQMFEPMRRVRQEGGDPAEGQAALHLPFAMPQSWKEPQRLAEHITAFSLGGILALRDAHSTGQPPEPERAGVAAHGER